MAETPRMFMLHRRTDVSGVSGTGTVAWGVEWPDGSAVVRWVGDRASTVVWPSIDDAMAIHGHGGATRVLWLDQMGPPQPVHHELWGELRGYVASAVDEGAQLNAADLLAYLGELHRRAMKPVREWMEAIASGESADGGDGRG